MSIGYRHCPSCLSFQNPSLGNDNASSGKAPAELDRTAEMLYVYDKIDILFDIRALSNSFVYKQKQTFLLTSLTMPSTYLVTGATGYQGGSAARQLLSKGHTVHALVRDPASSAAQNLAKLGAKLFEGHFDSLTSINAATKGCTGIFLNTFPSMTDPLYEIHTAQNFVTAAKASGTVTSLVVSTVFKTKENLKFLEEKEDDAYPYLKVYHRSKSGVEDVALNSGIENVTILRPTWLHYQYLSPYCRIHFSDIYEKEHLLTVSYPKNYLKGHFDPEDVGKFAAAAFLELAKFKGKTIELVNERLTFDEVAKTISRVSGEEVAVKYRSQEETEELAKTMPVAKLALLAQELDFEDDGTGLEEFGIKLSSLEQFLGREKKRLRETLRTGD